MRQVLVVDDDAGIRTMLRFTLEEEGYAVYEADDGEGALDVLRAAHEPMVVLLDLQMPHLSGEGLLASVARELDLAPRHAYVLMSANADRISATCLSLMSALAVPIVSKPFDLDLLLGMVDRAAMGLAAGTASASRPHAIAS